MGLVQKILVASLHNTFYTLWNKWRTRGKRSLFCLEDAPPMTGGVMYDCVEVCFPVLWWWLPLWRNGKGQKVAILTGSVRSLTKEGHPLCTDCCTVTSNEPGSFKICFRSVLWIYDYCCLLVCCFGLEERIEPVVPLSWSAVCLVLAEMELALGKRGCYYFSFLAGDTAQSRKGVVVCKAVWERWKWGTNHQNQRQQLQWLSEWGMGPPAHYWCLHRIRSLTNHGID